MNRLSTCFIRMLVPFSFWLLVDHVEMRRTAVILEGIGGTAGIVGPVSRGDSQIFGIGAFTPNISKPPPSATWYGPRHLPRNRSRQNQSYRAHPLSAECGAGVTPGLRTRPFPYGEQPRLSPLSVSLPSWHAWVYMGKEEKEKAIDHLETTLGIATPFDWQDQLFWIHRTLAMVFGRRSLTMQTSMSDESNHTRWMTYTTWLTRWSCIDAGNTG